MSKRGYTWCMDSRILGRSGLKVGALGLGCWAIGGAFWDKGGYMGYGSVDDAESRRALACALELGINFFDVAGVYGCGHAETLLGQALRQHPDALVAAKFGYTFDEQQRQVTGTDISAAGIKHALEQSLKRLGREHIDIYQLHLFDLPLETAFEVADVLEGLVQQGLIRHYSWCCEDPEKLSKFAQNTRASVVPILLNLFEGNRALPELCAGLGLGVMVRRPLGMGLLTGKIQAGHRFDPTDMRLRFGWNLVQGKQAKQLKVLEALCECLTTGGRTLAQGALAWLWAIHPSLVPIPGFKTVAQVQENVGAMRFGALSAATMLEIEAVLQTAANA
jgi:aryl-alcohol dehydrogenase-like predicted oxidoreductase